MSASSETKSPHKPAGVFGAYRATSTAFDEVNLSPGVNRTHWRKFVQSFDRLDREELSLRWENARRIIREHGVTYNVYGDPQGMDRAWELDMVPLLISPAEWARLERGLSQRARLLNLVLADLYGQQRLLRDTMLPPSLVFANKGFLRPCHGIRTPGEVFLYLQAFDLARSADGQWWVLADRTQAPSGAGYALENRMLMSRVLPEEFHECQVQRLASFFRIHRDMLRRIAPKNRDNPNVVLLTPGPHNETYFEHAYLARYLGFPLVEGGDLTVRDRCVFIKTLEGLQRVDVILRRVDDTFCDPLELRGDSFLGVAGLVEATRAGNVVIANALGSGLVESPAFLAFLPWLSRHLLGEELILPSVATWWCGQGKEQRYVLEHLDQIVVKTAFGLGRRTPYFGDRMSDADRQKLIAEIRQRPYDFVGQEQVNLSSAPTWVNFRLEPRPVVLRTYVAAGDGGSFVAMPGGLTRVSSSQKDPIVSMQSGGGSKDTWVMGDGTISTVPQLPSASELTRSERTITELPSRIADNLFWLGRYADRLESKLRLLRCVVSRMADESGTEGSPELLALSQTLFNLELVPIRFDERVKLKELELQVLQLIYSRQRDGSVRQMLSTIRHIAAVGRDRFSADTWRILNQLQLDSRSRPGRLPLANALVLLNTLIVDLAAFSGMEMENMTRGHGWRFLDFGRRLERGYNMAHLMQCALSTDIKAEAALEPLLEIGDSLLTYRRRYFAHAQLQGVLELLLMDETNPRSFAFQLKALAEHARHLPSVPSGPEDSDEYQSVMWLKSRLSSADPRALANAREEGMAGPIQELLTEMMNGLGNLSDQLTHRYFTHTVMQTS